MEPGYLYARFEDSALADKNAPVLELDTFKIGGGVHVGYRVLWGPVAITPRAGLAYHYLFAEAEGLDDDLKTHGERRVHRILVRLGAGSGHRVLETAP